VNREEQNHCIAFMDWVNLQSNAIPELRTILHIPNEGKRSRVAGAILKRMGLRPGAFDYLIPVPRMVNGQLCAGLIIEFKSKKGRLSDSQKEWRDMMHENNFLSLVATDWTVARTSVLQYLGVMHAADPMRQH
jgi:hypothetical protein